MLYIAGNALSSRASVLSPAIRAHLIPSLFRCSLQNHFLIAVAQFHLANLQGA